MAFDIKNLLHPVQSDDEHLTGEEVQHLVQPQNEEQQPDHKHEWDLLSKTYAPPRATINPADFDHVGKDMMDRMLFGVTVFLWECLVCKNLRKEHVLGSDSTPLDELIDKASLYGPQYYQKDGVTFQIAKMVSQQAAPILPMR